MVRKASGSVSHMTESCEANSGSISFATAITCSIMLAGNSRSLPNPEPAFRELASVENLVGRFLSGPCERSKPNSSPG